MSSLKKLLAEKALIARIRTQAAKRRGITRDVITGIGDDCAVLRVPPGHEALITTDFSLEGVHFRREWHPPESIGHRCLARGLSDIAAMGGNPIAAFLSLALPRDLPQNWVDRFIAGLLRLCKTSGCTLAGGDTAQSPNGILADIVVLGSVSRETAVLRSGARPGDRIYVSGELGGSAATLRRMMQNPKGKLNPEIFPRHFFPEPRLALGAMLGRARLASAMIDLSDGLSTDLAHICEESGVGAEIQAEAIPVAAIRKPVGTVDLQSALHGGEDYELLFTVPGSRRVSKKIAGISVTQIGEITRSRKIVLSEKGVRRQLIAQGWGHFRQGVAELSRRPRLARQPVFRG